MSIVLVIKDMASLWFSLMFLQDNPSSVVWALKEYKAIHEAAQRPVATPLRGDMNDETPLAPSVFGQPMMFLTNHFVKFWIS